MTTPKKRATTRTEAELGAELVEVRKKVEKAPSVNADTANLITAQQKEILGSVVGLNALDIMRLLNESGFAIQNTLDTVKNSLVEHVGKLGNVQQALTIHKMELEELHGKEVVAASTRALLDNYAVTGAALAAKQAQEEARIAEQTKELLKSYEETRVNKNREWLAEEATYQFNLRTKRRGEEDARVQKLLLEDRAIAEERRLKEEELLRREMVVYQSEAEMEELKLAVRNFPAELEIEKKRAVAVATGALASEHKHAVQLAEMASKNEKDMLSAMNQSLCNQIAQQKAQIDNLQLKLSAAEQRVEGIAREALQSASGRQALEAASSMASTLKDTQKK